MKLATHATNQEITAQKRPIFLHIYEEKIGLFPGLCCHFVITEGRTEVGFDSFCMQVIFAVEK